MKKLTALLLALVLALTTLTACSTEEPEGLFYDLTGLDPAATMLRIEGRDVPVEMYLYWVLYVCDYVADSYASTFVNEDGSIGGQNYEVMVKVDELLPQYTFTYEAVDQDALIMGLDSGKYAAAVGNFWHNEKREESYLFPEYPIGGGVEGIAVNKQYEDTVQSLEDFATAGLKLTPQEASGAMYDVFTQFNEENPDIALEFESGDVIASGEQMKWVIEGRYDGAAMFSSEYEELKETVDPDDQLYFVPFYAVKTWTLYPKNETQLVEDIDGAMKQLLDDGTLSEISIEWFGYDVYELFDEESK